MNITPEAKVMQSSLHPFHFRVLTYFPFASKLAWGYLGKGEGNTTTQSSLSYPGHMPVISN